MKRLLILLAFLTLSTPAWAEGWFDTALSPSINIAHILAVPTACDSGTYTVTSQEAITCRPYATSGIFWKPLPNAGSGGPTDYLYPNSDAIARHMLVSADPNFWGGIGWSTPGKGDEVGVPIYYGQASDPIYKITACTYCSAALNTYWHIPNQAKYSNTYISPWTATGDNFLNVWDQTNNKVLRLYSGNMTRAQGTLPNCTATDQAHACSLSVSHAQITDYNTSADYQLAESGGDSLMSGAAAPVIRQAEFMAGTINHAIYMVSPCVNQNGTPVFPSPNPANGGIGCNELDFNGDGHIIDDNYALRPVQGNLFFLDYTDAQIAGMTSIPAWKRTMLTALAHYGIYQGDTSGDRWGSFYSGRQEGGDAFAIAGTTAPIYAWLVSAGWTGAYNGYESLNYAGHFLAGLPSLVGPNCPTSTCGVEYHLHIAAECVAKGLAGLAGGCSTLPPAISSVSSGTPTSHGTTITWTSSAASSSQVFYGTTTSYGSNTTLDSNLVTSHSQAITGLAPATLYHFIVTSVDGSSNSNSSSDATFTTASTLTYITTACGHIAAGGATTLTISATVGTGESIAVTAGMQTGGATTISGVTWNTTETLTQVKTVANSSDSRADIWFLKNPSTGTHNIILTETNNNELAACVNTYTGVNQTTPYGTAVSDYKASGTTDPSLTVADSAAGELIIDSLAYAAIGAVTTTGTGQTSRGQEHQTGLTSATSTSAGVAGKIIGWTNIYTWAYAAVSLKPALDTLNAPTLSSPADSATGQAVNVTLSWADTNTSESGYKVRVKAPGLPYQYYTTAADVTSIASGVAFGSNLPYLTVISWSVQAIGDGSLTIDSSWPTDRSFTTIDHPVSPPGGGLIFIIW